MRFPQGKGESVSLWMGRAENPLHPKILPIQGSTSHSEVQNKVLGNFWGLLPCEAFPDGEEQLPVPDWGHSQFPPWIWGGEGAWPLCFHSLSTDGISLLCLEASPPPPPPPALP